MLEDLEDAGRLAAFRFENTELDVLLTDRLVELQVGTDGCEISVHTPDADRSEAHSVLSDVLSRLLPSGLRRYRFEAQFLIPLDEDYDTARSQIGKVAMPLGSRIGMTDYAFLVDGVEPTEQVLTYQIEFGVLERKEIPPRLTRHAGRVGTLRQVPYRVEDQEYPEVALFVESRWWVEKYSGDLVSFWEYSHSHACNLISTLQQELGRADG